MEIIRSAHLGSGVAGQLSEALLSAAALVDELPRRSLGRASPCRGWSVLDVISHLAAVTEKFGRFAAGAAGPVRQLPGDLAGTQPASRFRDVSEPAASAWREHPAALTAVCVLPFGSFDGATAAGISLFDAVIHQWDIAVGAGIDHTISEELAVVALGVAPLLVTRQARLSGHYAAPARPLAGAPPSGQLLAVTGRQHKTAAPAAAIKPGRLRNADPLPDSTTARGARRVPLGQQQTPAGRSAEAISRSASASEPSSRSGSALRLLVVIDRQACVDVPDRSICAAGQGGRRWAVSASAGSPESRRLHARRRNEARVRRAGGGRDTGSALPASCGRQRQRTRTPSMMTALGEDNIARSSRGSS